jgi:CDP-glycerol glycerophosphotransferase (TagB/SpsB family)
MEYQNEIKENSLLVTDYSSITFDFGYLNKPVIYTQFDIEEFYEGQVYDMGYFDFEKDGLGPVCRDYESTINQIIAYIKSGCKMEDKYSERVQNFYAHHDNRNCERVYQEILDME